MRVNRLQELIIVTIERQSLKSYAQFLLLILILVIPNLYSGVSHASELELDGTWTGYDRSNFRGELRHISLQLTLATDAASPALPRNLGPFEKLQQPYSAVQGSMETSRLAQRSRAGNSTILEQFDITGRYYRHAQFFILFFQAKGLYGSAAPQTAVLSDDGGSLAFFPAQGQPWLLTREPDQYRELYLLAKIEQTSSSSLDISSIKTQLVSSTTLPEQQIADFLNRAKALRERHAQAVLEGDQTAINSLTQDGVDLRTEVHQAITTAAQQNQAGVNLPSTAQLECPENVLAWANEVQAQGSSHQQYNGPAEIANLFRDKVFSSHFGAPFLELEALDRGRYGFVIPRVCSRNERLRHSRLFPSMASAFKEPSSLAGAGLSRFDAASGALALDILDQWLEQISDQNLKMNTSDFEIVLAGLGNNLWPAKAETLKTTGRQIVAEASRNTSTVNQHTTAMNTVTSTADLPQNPKYQICTGCHVTGLQGAPKLGDPESWAAPLASGIEQLVASVKEGKGHMPAMGGCADCSDGEILQFVATMLATTIQSGDESQEILDVSQSEQEAFLNKYGLYTMTLEEVWINKQQNQCGDLEPGSDLLGKFTNPSHPSHTPFTEEELTVMRSLNSGKPYIGVKIRGENFFDISNQKLLGYGGWRDSGIELAKGGVTEKHYGFVFLCKGVGTEEGRRQIAENKLREMRERCPMCEFPGAKYLDAIYQGDYLGQLSEGRGVLMSFARDKRPGGAHVMLFDLIRNNELTLLEQVMLSYMSLYSQEKDDCFADGMAQKTVKTLVPGYREIDELGNEISKVDPYTVTTVYRVPQAFEHACNSLCGREGGLSLMDIIDQHPERKGSSSEVGDIFSGIRQLAETHSCDNPIRKQFESNLLTLWQQEKQQPNNTKPTLKNAVQRVQRLR